MIAIKDMKEMPKSCIECPFIKAEGTKFFCSRIMKYIDKNNLENKHDDCPLVEIVICKECILNENNTCCLDGFGVADDYFCAGGKERVMAEYINRDKVLVELECGVRAGNYEEGYEKYMHINSMDDCIDTVKYFDTADVVERKKYDLLQQGYETLKHQLEEAFNRIDELDKLNGDMRDKIDKAIKEMERYGTFFKYIERHDLAGAVNYCIGVIQKEIGVEE